MTSSQFAFLQAEFNDEYVMAEWAERHALSDPGPAVIYARKTLESGVKWAFKHDSQLLEPYEDSLNAYINEPAFKTLADGRVFRVAKKIQVAGNKAVHESKPPTQLEAVEIVSALFQFCFWLAFTYGRAEKPDVKAWFDPRALPKTPTSNVTPTLKERQELEDRLAREAEETEAARERTALLSQSIEELEQKHAALVAEVAKAKTQAEAIPIEAHDWSEQETRDYKIDVLLKESGWQLRDQSNREFKVHGMPSDSGIGYVDYVLWGDDGKPLAIVEAKKTRVSPRSGQQQAKLYADSLENETGQRPVIFYSNGYEHWLWDDAQYIPRQVQGFLTKGELELAIQRRTSRVPPGSLEVNADIVERYYQHRAIRSVGERFDIEKQRKALLVMATGSGKTRTVIALCDLLMRANHVKRVLFLADRTALVNQAVNAFKARAIARLHGR